MKIYFSILILILTISGKAQQKNPITYIPYVCKQSELKYIVIDTTTKYYLLYIADKNRQSTSDSLYFESTYTDEMVSNFLEKVLVSSEKTAETSICFSENKKLLLSDIRSSTNGVFQEKYLSRDKNTIDSLTNELEIEYTAGVFRSVNKEIPIYNFASDSLRDRSYRANPATENPFIRHNRARDTVFVVEKIAIRTDYNRINRIGIAGVLKYKDATLQKDTSLRLVITNLSYSLSLSALNDGEYAIKLPVLSTHSLYINIADVIQYEPFAEEMSYIIANQSIEVPVGGIAKVRKRTLSNYISFRTFLDPLVF